MIGKRYKLHFWLITRIPGLPLSNGVNSMDLITNLHAAISNLVLRSLRKRNPVELRTVAQSDATAQQCANSDDVEEEEQKLSSDADDDRDPESEPAEKPNSGRSGNGQFTKGNRHSEGNAGNPNPVGAFTPGNQAARKHGAYARYLNADDLFEAAADSDLHDELIFTRARALSVTKTMRKIHEDLAAAESVEARIELYDKLLKAESALDRNIGRIESIENSLSKLRLDAINGPRLTADMYRIKAATSKLKAETQKLTSEGKGVTTPLSEAVKEVRDSGQDGLL
ncbi:terminase [Yersinia enterocolitica]